MIFREAPPTAASQREKILRLLREAARLGRGVAGDVLRSEHHICQAPARVWELKNQYGYQIETRQDHATRMATYFFRGDPPEGWQPPAKQTRLRFLNSETLKAEKSQKPSGDWYERQTGKTRPPDKYPRGLLFRETHG